MMTERTSELLAVALEQAGFPDLAEKARRDEYHDFKSQHETPSMLLHMDLSARATRSAAAQRLLERHHNGEFDADLKESEDWATSPEGQATFGELLKGQ